MPHLATRPMEADGVHYTAGDEVPGAETWPTFRTLINLGWLRPVDVAELQSMQAALRAERPPSRQTFIIGGRNDGQLDEPAGEAVESGEQEGSGSDKAGGDPPAPDPNAAKGGTTDARQGQGRRPAVKRAGAGRSGNGQRRSRSPVAG